MNELPTPETNVERYLAAIAGADVEPPSEPSTSVEWFLDKWLENSK